MDLEGSSRGSAKSGKTPKLEHRKRVEEGQGEIWILLAVRVSARRKRAVGGAHGHRAARARGARHACRQTRVGLGPPRTVPALGAWPRAWLGREPARARAKTRGGPRQNPGDRRLSGHEVALCPERLTGQLGFGSGARLLARDRDAWLRASEVYRAARYVGGAVGSGDAGRRSAAARPASGAVARRVMANRTTSKFGPRFAELERGSAAAREGLDCPEPRPPAPTRGEINPHSPGRDHRLAERVRRSPIARHDVRPRREARSRLALQSARGWLTQASRVPGLATAARARLLGSAGASALVIEIHALEGRAHEAVAASARPARTTRRGAATEQDCSSAGAPSRRPSSIRTSTHGGGSSSSGAARPSAAPRPCRLCAACTSGHCRPRRTWSCTSNRAIDERRRLVRSPLRALVSRARSPC